MIKKLMITLSCCATLQAQELNIEQAKKIIELPAECILVEYPNKLGNVLGSADDLKTPKALRPIFYGCFDWHSSVHGYWSMIALLKEFPGIDQDQTLRRTLRELITVENVETEIAFFNDKNNKSFERTYGWAWLLQLQAELHHWDDPDAQAWARNLQPLADLLVDRYKAYLPKLVYPIRGGKHDNTAFGLSLAIDYARAVNDKAFEKLIIDQTHRLYQQDKACDLAYEPSGSDFLSACLEEALLMSKTTDAKAYEKWLKGFMPELFKKKFDLKPGIVSDRTDGQLVHLDGLNFSRATALYQIEAKLPHLKHLHTIADNHLNYSLGNITNDDYMGSHWLGTFALYALKMKHQAANK